MRIQSVQNQQMQSRPNFEALAYFKPHFPKFYDDAASVVCKHLPLDATDADNLLKKLAGSMLKITPDANSESNIQRFGASPGLRQFKLGEDIIVLHSSALPNDHCLYIQHPDGSETSLFRESIDIPEPEFNNVVENLAAMPAPVAPLSTMEEGVVLDSIIS